MKGVVVRRAGFGTTALARSRRATRADRRAVPRSKPKSPHEQLGTLGGGNHFIEALPRYRGGRVWVMLHSGSRGIGNRIGQYFIELARSEDMAQPRRSTCRTATSRTSSEGTEHFDDYVEAVAWAQDYAAAEPRADDGGRDRAVLREERSGRSHARRRWR